MGVAGDRSKRAAPRTGIVVESSRAHLRPGTPSGAPSGTPSAILGGGHHLPERNRNGPEGPAALATTGGGGGVDREGKQDAVHWLRWLVQILIIAQADSPTAPRAHSDMERPEVAAQMATCSLRRSMITQSPAGDGGAELIEPLGQVGPPATTCQPAVDGSLSLKL